MRCLTGCRDLRRATTFLWDKRVIDGLSTVIRFTLEFITELAMRRMCVLLLLVFFVLWMLGRDVYSSLCIAITSVIVRVIIEFWRRKEENGVLFCVRLVYLIGHDLVAEFVRDVRSLWPRALTRA